MFKLSNIKMPIGFVKSDLEKTVSATINDSFSDLRVIKQSLDARHKSDIHMVLTVAFNSSKNSKFEIFEQQVNVIKDMLKGLTVKKTNLSPIVVGSGPAGLFAGLVLANLGLKPMVLERGESVENRQKSVLSFNKTGELNEESNIQFGEGGAGTFSDGKLNTGTSNEFISVVLGEFVKFGANAEIEYSNKPHIGTDKLRNIVKNMREEIISLGGQVLFNTKVESLLISNGKISGVKTSSGDINADTVILATGHSGRDTYKMLQKCGVKMERKAFAIGARVEHPQHLIDMAQYGKSDNLLPAADYKLACKTSNNRGCFTFCMCPGGEVVAGASEKFGVVTNGMSLESRSGKFANSAVLVGVSPNDYGVGDELKGIDFQREFENIAFKIGNNYEAPAMSVRDFMQGKLVENVNKYRPTYPRGVVGTDLSKCLPKYVVAGMREGFSEFDRKIKGFGNHGLLIGVETRSSSPVRILRDERGMSNIIGLYPCGEGSGYAGGITSSAVDGIKTALHVATTKFD